MEIIPEQKFDEVLITPVISCNFVNCSDAECGEHYGFCITLGWLFWTITFFWSSHE